jgi:putative addiction module killer protein
MESEVYKTEIYRTTNGKEPCIEWLESLDRPVRSRINARIPRIIEMSNFGIYEPVADGVFELKFDFGPGYRVYFSFISDTIVLLLLGGSKKSQKEDVRKAKKYWADHLSIRKRKHEKISKL